MIKLSLYLASVLLGTNFSASTPQPTVAPARTQVAAAADVGISMPAPALTPLPAAPQVVVTNAEQRFITLTNGERRRSGLNELTTNSTLVEVARRHSREMWEKDYFDHVSPTAGLETPMKRYLDVLGHTPRWAYLGENLFYCSIVDVARGHKSLMESPRHRENILNERFEQIGVGIFISPDGQFWVTELFLAQRD